MDPTDLASPSPADLIRGAKIHAMESNALKSLTGYLVAAALAGYAAWDDWSALLQIWGPLVTLVVIARIILAQRTVRTPPRPMSRRDEDRLMVVTGLVSASLSVVPIWIAMHSETFVSAIMLTLLVSAMWGGALVQAPVLSSAISYSTASIPIWLACLAISGLTADRLQLALLMFISIGVAVDAVQRYARDFESGLRQKLDLETQRGRLIQQTEVIGLLLKDHEDQSSDWLWQTSASGRICTPSRRFGEAFQTDPDRLDQTLLIDLLTHPSVAGNGLAVGRLNEQLRSGRSFRDLVVPGLLAGQCRWWSLSGRAIVDAAGRGNGFRGVMSDVTAAKEAQAHVDYLAHHDPLTGLANRIHFGKHVQAELDLDQRSGITLLTLDLDGFKPVNDRFGHPVGDSLLTQIGRQLRQLTASRGLVARLGGDEFAIAAFGLEVVDVERFCEALIEAVAVPKRIGDRDVVVGASIGIAMAPADGRTVDALLKNADAALYRAKREGRGQYRFFEPGMDYQIQQRHLLLQDLRAALASGTLALHYQPYVESSTGQVTGCEALLRWRHPTRGSISPAEFIPIAEESGLIDELGRWVIDEACATAVTWPADLRVSVNVSPRQFKDRSLPAYIAATVRRHGLAPARLEIEVTEAVLIDDTASAMASLRQIRDIGVKLSLDDFGTGYSSLRYLRDFPFDKVKIDRSFVQDIDIRHDSQVIVRAFQSIADGLGMTITAEGVETEDQAARLRSVGCHELQGFLFSAARPREELGGLLRRGTTLTAAARPRQPQPQPQPSATRIAAVASASGSNRTASASLSMRSTLPTMASAPTQSSSAFSTGTAIAPTPDCSSPLDR